MNNPDICVVTSAHDFNDDRIFHKQIKSLLEEGLSITYLSKPTEVEFHHPSFTHLDIPQEKSKLKRVLAIHRLYKKCLEVNARVYHLHDPELVILASKLRKAGKKVIFDIHEDYKSSILATGLPFKGLIANLWDRYEKQVCNKLSFLICADTYIFNRYKNPNKIVLGNYPPLRFLPSIRPEKPETFTIVYAGGVNKARGVERLIQALDKVKGAFRLSLIGPCKDENLLKLIRSKSYIDYHGKVDWAEVGSYLKKGSLGVALYEPSINFTYCTGEGIVKIFEYLGNGLPILTSDFPNLKVFVDDNNVGDTTDPLNIEEIASKIEVYLNNPDLLKAQSIVGYNLVREKYNWDLASKSFVKLYKEDLLELA